MFPKKIYKKRKPALAKRGKFSDKIILEIIERDKVCVLCGGEGDDIHHARFKSQMGRGVYTNGVLICRSCHNKAHRVFEVAQSIRDILIDMYGPNYYKDEHDD